MLSTRVRSVTALLLVSLLLSAIAGPRPARAVSSAAASLSVTPASAAPGAAVLVQGQGFAASATLTVYWDSVVRGHGLFTRPAAADGTFALALTVPPTAVPGPHTVWVEDTSANTASAGLLVTLPAQQVLYLYAQDTTTAADFKSLLTTNGLSVTVASTLDLAQTPLSLKDFALILIGADTGNSTTWGTPAIVDFLRRAGRPIIGLGEGGYAFLGKLSLTLGYPHGAHGALTSLQAVASRDPVFHEPYDLGILTGPVQVYTATSAAVEIYLPKPDGQLDLIGTEPYTSTPTSYYPVLGEKSYALWGYAGAPKDMTPLGQKLFINLVERYLQALQADTLILTNFSRMTTLGYPAGEVQTLEDRITQLVAAPPASSHMRAIRRDLTDSAPDGVVNAYAVWNTSQITSTNSLAAAIDSYVEGLKHNHYPNLRYLILVGSHEIIPMQARPADNYDETSWVPPAGYLRNLYNSTYNGAAGYYLTDSVYGDLAYINNHLGVDGGLVPELAVGRLVETPAQITTLVDNYLAASGYFARGHRAAIASYDYMDGGQAAANAMGAGVDTTLVLSGFVSSLVAPKINAFPNFIYLSGHGDYNWITTRRWDQGFMAGATNAQGDTEELNTLPNAVIVAAGCHNGVSFTNQLYHAYNSTTDYGDFPERFAQKQVGVYLGSTGYTWITASGNSTNVANVGYSEKVAVNFVKHMLTDGVTTAGEAYRAAIADYVTAQGTPLDGGSRRALAIATLYGIPNYTWPAATFGSLVPPIVSQLSGYTLSRLALPGGMTVSAAASEQVTFEVKDWSVDGAGVITIPGANYQGGTDTPILPVVAANWTLPGVTGALTVTWDSTASVSTTLTNDVPNLVAGTVTALGTVFTVTNPLTKSGFYPATPFFTSTVASLGGAATQVSLGIVPVQYDPAAHQTRIWTKLAFTVTYTGDAAAASVDADSDSLPDYWETTQGLDAYNSTGDNGATGDPDQDRLDNQTELALGTTALNPDTDGDGVPDGIEVAQGTDPLNPGSRLYLIYMPAVTRP